MLTRFLSMSLSVGVHTKNARCISPTKHQNVSDSFFISHKTGASKSLMPCVYLNDNVSKAIVSLKMKNDVNVIFQLETDTYDVPEL